MTLTIRLRRDAQAEPRGWRTPFLPPLIPVSLLLLTGFFVWEKRLERKALAFYASPDAGEAAPAPPLLPPAVWNAPHFASMLAIVFAAWASFNTSTYYVNLM